MMDIYIDISLNAVLNLSASFGVSLALVSATAVAVEVMLRRRRSWRPTPKDQSREDRR